MYKALTGRIFSYYVTCFCYYTSDPSFFTCRRGVHTIEKDLTVWGPMTWKLSHSVYDQLKDFLGLLLDSMVESENVMLACGVVLIGLK